MKTDKLGDFKYKKTLDCIQQKYKKHRIKEFYKGYTICMIRSFPVNSVLIIVYRIMQRLTNVSSN